MKKLEIGVGVHDKSSKQAEDIITVDMNKAVDPDIHGDIRAIFCPDYDLEDYPQLTGIADAKETFTDIIAVHIIEHVQWIYQHDMFAWFEQLLEPGGTLHIETPNLNYIAQVYLKNKRWRWASFVERLNGRKVKLFPEGQHAMCPTGMDEVELRWWTNYRLFSGCGRGDYHHCIFDAVLLRNVLQKFFKKVKVLERRDVLFATAIKKEDHVYF